jgi:hypothetical protein
MIIATVPSPDPTTVLDFVARKGSEKKKLTLVLTDGTLSPVA